MAKIIPTYIDQLKRFEGLRLRAYKPSGEKKTNYYTIGYGHYGITDVNKVITEDEAEDLLISDVDNVEQALVNLLGVTLVNRLTDGQYTALVDMVFNVGIARFRSSTIFRLLTIDDGTAFDLRIEKIPNEFSRWVYSGKNKLAGLVKRAEWRKCVWLNIL